jgi:hypothetical protein
MKPGRPRGGAGPDMSVDFRTARRETQYRDQNSLKKEASPCA